MTQRELTADTDTEIELFLDYLEVFIRDRDNYQARQLLKTQLLKLLEIKT